MFLTGRTFDAVEAAAMGLVTTVVPDDRLDEAVADALGELAHGYPQGFAETKRLLNADLVERIDRHGAEVAARSAALFGSDQAREAMLAFLDRRK